ncbi:hypothetical protein [Dyella sp. ASV21]|uniref:hypothetical protein n=1 Tax=Dyella sp. ASV21 TaxID=2795114 RepID=UPI0018EB17AF|nr:hypothetical protein [Dyella sp. ASV21]
MCIRDSDSALGHLLLPNADRTLLPGQYVTISANLGEQHNVCLLYTSDAADDNVRV